MALSHSQNKSKRQRRDEAGAKLRAAFEGAPGERPAPAKQADAEKVLAEAWSLAGEITDFAVKYLRHFMIDPKSGAYIAPAEFHRELYRILLTEQYAAIAAPREHAKSTVVSVIFVLYCICYKLRHFIVLISDTQPQAALQLAAVKEEIENNPALREDFGELAGDKKWDVNDCRTSTGISVVARGAGQSLRGLRFRQWRPDLVICDDLENEEAADNPDTRDKLKRWFLGTVMNLGKGCQVFVIGTILHFDALLAELLDEDKFKTFVKRKYEAVDDEWTAESVLWPAKWDLQALKDKEHTIGSVMFNQEWRNRPISSDTQIFQEAWITAHAFRRSELADRETRGESFFKVTYHDPAISQKRKADFFASVTLTVDAKGYLYITRAEQARMPFGKQREFIIARYDEEKPAAVGIEQQAYQEALKQEMEDVGRETGRYINIVGVSNLTDKFLRISSISSLVENGTIRFCLDGTQKTLISQLLFLGKIKDDLADALQGAVQLARQYNFSAAIETSGAQVGSRQPESRGVRSLTEVAGRQKTEDFVQRDRRSLWR
jgi:predicted phage terminase large subunit-like protein